LNPLRIQVFPDAVLDVVLETAGNDLVPESPLVKKLGIIHLEASISGNDTSGTESSTSTNTFKEELYRNAVRRELSSVKQNQGTTYGDDRGVPQDYSETIENYLRAADQGQSNAQLHLGVLQDYPKAMEWYLKVADQGHASAQFNLGVLYDNGRGVPQDYSKTMEWYLKAAHQGYAGAQFNLGVLYDNGKGVPQDYSKAMEWYLKAVNQGHAGAQINLGVMYEHGMRVP
ncbi:hypothetical protein BGZ58_009925, partial [Dissophora ornata]